jgi:hypothetical protein
MIVIAFAVFGVLLGILTARRNRGNRKDMAQYAAGFGIAFGLLGMIVAIVVERLLA